MTSIQIELCQQDRDRIDTLLTAFTSVIAVLVGSKPEAPKEEPKPEAPKEEPKEEPKTEAPKEEPKTETPKTEAPKSHDDLLRVVRRLIAPTQDKTLRDAAKALVKEYADNVPSVPEDKIAEVIERLEALERGE